MKCKSLTKKGNPCPFKAEKKRNGYCHVHDPEGKCQQNIQAHRLRKQHNKTQSRVHKPRTRKGVVNNAIALSVQIGDETRCAYIKRGRQCKHPPIEGMPFCIDHKRMGRKRLKKGKNNLQELSINGTEFIYLFDVGFDNLYKIGKSRNVKQRLESLRAGNPRIKCVNSVDVKDMTRAEKVLHARYKHCKKEREIFCFDEEMLEDVILSMNAVGLISRMKTP